jgi:tetratricopeptide (TPR) repeat protein
MTGGLARLLAAAKDHLAAGRAGEAADLLRRAVALAPDSAATRANLGHALRAAGRSAEAEAALRRAIALDPRLVSAHLALGIVLEQRGARTEAIGLFRRAVSLAPGDARALTHLGAALLADGDATGAESAHRAAVEANPAVAEARVNLAAALSALGRDADAEAECRQAIALKPGLALAHAALGGVLSRQGKHEQALQACRAAVRLDPGLAAAQTNLAGALLLTGASTEAEAAARRALAVAPASPDALRNLGAALDAQAKPAAALEAFDRALAIAPDDAEIHFARALTLLRGGDFAQGLAGYEWRWRTRAQRAAWRDFPQPQWRGEDIAGKTLLLHAEQGLGDAIQFARYAPVAAGRGARVLLEVQPGLVRLLSGIEGVQRIVARGEALPPFDLHCPLLSLPLALGTTPATIPANVPYLRAEPERAAAWRARLAAKPGLRVGLCWQGNPQGVADLGRSPPLAALAPLAAVPGVRLIALQKGVGREQLAAAPRVEDPGEGFDAGPHAFLDTAAAMMALDLVISADTAPAHLAGALGRPVWIALKRVADWRWMLDRDDTPWYPTAWLFRQDAPGDWAGVFARMARALEREIEGRR